MEVNILNIRESLNKAYLKVKPNRTQIETFKKNIINLYDRINESESEEFHKNIISEFLKNTWYSPDHYINTKGRADLVIHTGKDTGTPVGVLFETKKPRDRSEMPTAENLNSKSFYELILYYLRERIKGKNIGIKYLVVTNIYEWFIFSSNDFERLFANNKKLVEQFTDFEEGRLADSTTDFFYKNIAEPFVNEFDSQISVTHFDIRDYESIIRNADTSDDNRLIALYKIFSPEHLLKLPFANDSNSLDKTFYSELLHIIGLEETKEGSKKVIGRKKEEKRNPGSFIENAITILKSEDCLSQLSKRSDSGNTPDDQLFNLSLELSITWINRILFLKLLEGQLVKYNGGDEGFRFLNSEKVHDFDELNKLFFQVLAVKEQERSPSVKQKFTNVPFLNSSLFEPSELEHKTIRINSLDNNTKLPLPGNTILKDKKGKKMTGEMEPLRYLFEFLEAYDFSSEGSEDIQEENKTLINASVLGLIFEKINGYKDGSFFTPGFITMYMCHETITRAVVQKFNEAKGWSCKTIIDIYNKNPEIVDANRIINSLRICDPAVGSGHFLVSALNEIISIKSELGVLADKEGKRLKDYNIEVINDELVITDEHGKFFEYSPKSKESQRVQETLFREKQIIIENCLFGVDINPNSVKICRLRLWIELLKNAYYNQDPPVAGRRSPVAVLETLPNIDINIKCGNSLISRYPLDADIKTALKSSKWNVDNYREAVMSYRNAQSKDEKRSMEQLIEKIKNDFETEVSKNDKRFLKLNKLNGELLSLTNQSTLFELTKTKKEEWNKKVKKLTEEINKFETQLEEIKSNKIYENAFEWRFEFPEVLNNDGDFVGFDVVMGNPPYISGKDFDKGLITYLAENYITSQYQLDLYISFIERGIEVLKRKGYIAFITPNSWLKNMMFTRCRKYLIDNVSFDILFPNLENVFDEASVDTLIFIAEKDTFKNGIAVHLFQDQMPTFKHSVNQKRFLENERYVFDVEINPALSLVLKKVRANSIQLSDIAEITRGVNPYDKYRGQSEETISNKAYHASYKKDDTFLPEIRGKHVNRYYYKWDGKHYISYGSWLAAPRDMKFFTGKRLIMRQVLGEKLNCTVIEEDFIIDQSVFIAVLRDDFKPYINTIQGLLASNLISKFFKFTSNEFDAVFPKIKIGEFKELPIFKNLIEAEASCSKPVSQILLAKKSDPAADTGALEAEIDRLVYELYGLTEEEIRIVEGG
jgi:hypothetical protein